MFSHKLDPFWELTSGCQGDYPASTYPTNHTLLTITPQSRFYDHKLSEYLLLFHLISFLHPLLLLMIPSNVEHDINRLALS